MTSTVLAALARKFSRNNFTFSGFARNINSWAVQKSPLVSSFLRILASNKLLTIPQKNIRGTHGFGSQKQKTCI